MARGAQACATGLSHALCRDIRSYQYYSWSRQKGVEENILLSELPASLRHNLVADAYERPLRSSPLFHHSATPFVQAVALALQPETFLPGDLILEPGDVARELFVLTTGSASVIDCSLSEQPVRRFLQAGSVYGEADFLLQKRRVLFVKALDFCDCAMLSLAAYEACLLQYPAERSNHRTNSVRIQQRAIREETCFAANFRLAKVQWLASTSFEFVKPKFRTWHPASEFRRGWDVLQILVTFYIGTVVPLRICFPAHLFPTWLLLLEYLLDLLFIVDVYMQDTRFAYVSFDGSVENEPEKIARNYRSTWMKIDVVASLPLNMLVALLVLQAPLSTSAHPELLAWLRINKLLRVGKIPYYFGRIRYFVQELSLGIDSNVVRIIQVCMTFFCFSLGKLSDHLFIHLCLILSSLLLSLALLLAIFFCTSSHSYFLTSCFFFRLLICFLCHFL